MSRENYCAIDFGTSNSALVYAQSGGMCFAELEPGFTGMPTAVFYNVEDMSRSFGREAIAAYVDGFDGRLMRSIKSILGSDLIEQTTEVGPGIAISYRDVVIGYLRHLKQVAEVQHCTPLEQAVIGRPVFFVDGHPIRDQVAQATLEEAAHCAGFKEVAFQFEPIAAALDYESNIVDEQVVLVADIGGGTSDFSLVRVGPQRHARLDRKADILANHGIHLAGTDFDYSVNLAAIMPHLGFGAPGANDRRVPGEVYYDLATWHLINTVYAPNRVIELRNMISMYADKNLHRRIMQAVTRRLGHQLAAQAEKAKIEVSMSGQSLIELEAIEAGLTAHFDELAQAEVLHDKIQRIAATARETVRMAGLGAGDVHALYFTGGSTGLISLTEQIAACFPEAKKITGERFSSVANGLGIYAQKIYA